MAKIKLTKNELKKKKDALKMYKSYLPTLQLKKQQLQMEIRGVETRLAQLVRRRKRSSGSSRPGSPYFPRGTRHARNPVCLFFRLHR